MKKLTLSASRNQRKNIPRGHRRCTPAGLAVMSIVLAATISRAAVFSNVVETGGDNEATDTITAKWTGQTFPVSIAGEPFLGAVVGSNFSVPAFGNNVPSFVDRAHRYLDDPGSATSAALPIPAYLVGGDYIMSGNDNRDNAGYSLSVSLLGASRIFMLIDNRLGDSLGTNPPVFDATHMQWITTGGWLPTNNGLNRLGSKAVPDEVPFDEGSDGTINQYFSVYYKDFAGGNVTLLQADNAGQNMYGVVGKAIPEPAAASIAALGLLAIAGRRRRNGG